MKISSNRKICILIVLLWVASPFNQALAQGLRSTVNSSRIGVGDSFTLTLSADRESLTSAPDLGPLQKDFRIVSTGQSSQTNIVNGARSDTFSWVITLAPKTKGILTVPGITAGDLSSSPRTIEVVEQSVLPADGTLDGKIAIDVTVEKGTHYIHQEIPVTVVITAGAGVRDVQLQGPEGNDFIATKSGEDKVNSVDRNGQRLTQVERKYLLKPQKSGSLTIPPVVVVATLENSDAKNSFFPDSQFAAMLGNRPGSLFGSSLFQDMFSPRRQVTLSSAPVVIDVQAKPSSDGKWFLPAKDVQLQSSWVITQPQFSVGETTTRKIQLFVLGASTEQLPDLEIADTEGVRMYVDRTADHSVDTDEGTAVVREFTLSVIPTQAGDVQLPAIAVQWWDVKTDTEQVAKLPAETIHVVGGSGGSAQNGSAPVGSVDSQITTALPDDKSESSLWGKTLSWLSANRVEFSVAGLLLLIIGIALYIARRRRNYAVGQTRTAKNTPPRTMGDSSVRNRNALSVLEHRFAESCNKNDSKGSYGTLNEWLLTVRGAAYRSSDLDSASPMLAAEITKLENALFAESGNEPFSGHALLKAFRTSKSNLLNNSRKKPAATVLPALYPAFDSGIRTS